MSGHPRLHHTSGPIQWRQESGETLNDQPECPPTPTRPYWIFVKCDTNRDLATNAINPNTKDKDGKDVTANGDIFIPLKIALLYASIQPVYVSAPCLLYSNNVFVVSASECIFVYFYMSASASLIVNPESF